MVPVMWNVDTQDTMIGTSGLAKVTTDFQALLSGANLQSLNKGVLLLEHDTQDQTVNFFRDVVLPQFKAAGLKPVYLSECTGVKPVYQNIVDDSGKPPGTTSDASGLKPWSALWLVAAEIAAMLF